METSPPAGPSYRPLFVLAGLAIAVGGAAGWYFFLRPAHPPQADVAPARPAPPPDPRLTYPTPFRNVHPDVQYVGDAACARCHADVDRCYHQHPMGRSAAVIGQESPLEKYDPASQNPFRTPTHLLAVLRDGSQTTHQMTGGTDLTAALPPSLTRVDLVLGSGTRGRSYLSFDRGAVWQTAVSWFTDDARWNVSPGFDLGKGGRRPIPAGCLYCHVNQTDPVAGSTNLYRQAAVGPPAIGCERCHGPGGLHVRHQTDTPAPGHDDTIVNPARLPAALQLDVCRQCHLQGEQRVIRRGRDLFEYRPGLPLDLFQTTFARRPDLADGQRSVGQFEQMEVSRCFTASGGAMTCTTCHDPHEVPAAAATDTYFRGKCLTCHATRGCTQPEPVRAAKNDSCVACHMPRRDSASIAHAAVTDHRIPRHADKPPAPPAAAATEFPLVHYRHGTPGPGADELERDLGVALAHQSQKAANPADARALATAAGGRLVTAGRRWPDDHVVWLTLAGLGDPKARADAARKANALQPDSEPVLVARVLAEATVREFAAAVALTDRLIGMNPGSIEHRQLRASVLVAKRDWAAAEATCREALALNPMAAEARVLLALALAGQGKRDESKVQADLGLALEPDPAMQRQFRDWLRSSR